jgi:hypothetical protein
MIVTIRMDAQERAAPMIPSAMVRQLLGGAIGALTIAADVARHVAWYVGHQVSGQPRDASEEEKQS